MKQDSDNQAGSEPDSPCPIEPDPPPDESSATRIGEPEETGRARPRRRSARHDPKITESLSERDFLALLFIGIARICAQYQLHARVFAGLSEVPVSRCVGRLLRLGLIEVHRWQRVGINLLRLTNKGFDTLVDLGRSKASQIFVAAEWTSAGQAAHTLWITDALVCAMNLPGSRTVLPCWALRRKFGKQGAGMKVPDLLIAAHAADGSWSRLVAVEIDLGNERLGRNLIPRLAAVRDHVEEWSSGEGRLLVLVRGSRRADAIRRQMPAHQVPADVVVLPSDLSGRAALVWLGKLLSVVLGPEVVNPERNSI